MRVVGMMVGLFLMITLAFARESTTDLGGGTPGFDRPSQGRPGSGSTPTPIRPGRAQPMVPAYLTIGVEQSPSYRQEDRAVSCPGYTASEVVETEEGVTAVLTLAGDACDAYGRDRRSLKLSVEYQSAEKVRVYIADAKGENFDLSTRRDIYDGAIYRPGRDSRSPLYEFSHNASPFEFWVTRVADREVLFDTRGHKLVFEDQYLELTTNKGADANIYGLGDTIHALRLGDNFTRTLFAADIGDREDANLYGSHPFYLEHRYGGGADRTSYSAHGVFFLTSNNMDVLIRPDYLQYRVTGGVIDLYIYTGPSPMAVTQQYVKSIGLPAMQSYWTLGFHQCRWGYTSTAETREVVENYRAADIPLETVWNDIDYMLQYRDWTLDPNYLSLSEFVDSLHDAGQYYVPIVDAAIYASNPTNRSEDSYDPYYSGLERDTFLRNPDGSIYYGDVWPGYTAFPDWLAENTTEWWLESMQNFSRESTSYDGIWLDMNEVSSFCVGSCGTGRLQDNQVHPPFALPGEAGFVTVDHPEGVALKDASEAASASDRKATQSALAARAVGATATFDVNYPPYAINNYQQNGDLATHAVSPNATHQDGTLEYDIHNLFGWGETVATYGALQKIRPGERPFIISRSTFPGAGTMTGHWGGDNYSKWLYMYYSIPQALIFQLFGIPMMGPDTCGFFGNSDEELCSRWMQLSAFFPFYRNHNTLNADSQEAYVWESVAEATRTAMQIRYSLLPYWYTLFDTAHTDGSPVIRALLMEFPDDPSLAAADRQFLVGDAIMVIPVLEPQVDYTKGVFPGVGSGERWFDWYTKAPVTTAAGQNVTISAPLGHIPVYVRGGHVVPMQGPGYTTAESRANAWSLLVALDKQGLATGSLYQDDGISESPATTSTVRFSVRDSSLSVNQTGSYAITQPLANVTVLGLTERPTSVEFAGQDVATVDWEYDDVTLTLEVKHLQKLTPGGAFVTTGGKVFPMTTEGTDGQVQVPLGGAVSPAAAAAAAVTSGWTLSWASD